MELYYGIIKNVYKTYTKHIISIYKFLIGHVKLVSIQNGCNSESFIITK